MCVGVGVGGCGCGCKREGGYKDTFWYNIIPVPVKCVTLQKDLFDWRID